MTLLHISDTLYPLPSRQIMSTCSLDLECQLVSAVIGVSSSPRTRTGSDNAGRTRNHSLHCQSYASHCSGSSLPTTGQVLATDKRFSTLLLALEIAFGNETGLDPPFTVFAPTAQAFNKLNNSTLTALLQNPEELAQGCDNL